MQENYRNVLKDSTEPDHLAVDQAISRLDIARPSDLAAFLSIHLSCFRAMSAACSDAATRARLDALSDGIERDLTTLGQSAQPVRAALAAPLDPLALDYVLEGSRLGTQVLKRRWAASNDPLVQSADAYFSLPNDAKRWRATCAALDDVALNSPRAARITKDTKALFNVFLQASLRQTRPANTVSEFL